MTEDRKHKRVLFLSAALVIATLAAYEPIRHNDFVSFDDDVYIKENPNVRGGITLDSVVWAFTKSHASNWHPLTWLSHQLDCQLFGLNPLGHHLDSLLIHIVNAVMLFWLLTNLTGAVWPSAFAAAVFALHPLQVESVAWAAGRKTVASGFFWLLTIAVYIWYTKRPGVRRYLLLLGTYALCIMTKPVVVTLPFVLLLLDYWPLERLKRGQTADKKTVPLSRILMEKVPLLVLSGILCVITFFAQKEGGALKVFEQMPLDGRIANAFVSYIRYIGKVIWPSELAVVYPYTRENLSNMIVLICLLVFTLITVFSIYTVRSKKYITVGWLWYVGTLVPMIGLVQAGVQAMADRYMYLSMIGLLMILGWGVKDLIGSRFRWKVITAATTVILLSGAGIVTRTQVGYWCDSMTLIEHALEVTENNESVEFGYGCALFRQGQLDEAAVHLANAVRLNPGNFSARSNLGVVYLKLGRFDEATACFNEILKHGDSSQAYYYLGVISFYQTKYDDAINHLTTALKKGVKYPDAYSKTGAALLATGRPNEAIEYLNEALHLDPGQAEVCANLGRTYRMLGKKDLAIENWVKAVELKPDNTNFLNSLALLLISGDNVSAQEAGRAVEFASRACELTDYKDAVPLDTLAAAYAAEGRFDDAVKTAKQAIEAAKARGQEDLAGRIENRMGLYKEGRRYLPK